MKSYGTPLFQRTLNVLINEHVADEAPFIDILLRGQSIEEDINFILGESLSLQEGLNEKYLVLGLTLLEKHFPDTLSEETCKNYFEKLANYRLPLSSFELYDRYNLIVLKLNKKLGESYERPKLPLITAILSTENEKLCPQAFDLNFELFPSLLSSIGLSFVFHKIDKQTLQEKTLENYNRLISPQFLFDAISGLCDNNKNRTEFLFTLVANIIKKVDATTALDIIFHFSPYFGQFFPTLNHTTQEILFDIISEIPTGDTLPEEFNSSNQLTLISKGLSNCIQDFGTKAADVFTEFLSKRKEADKFQHLPDFISNYGLVIYAAKFGPLDQLLPVIIKRFDEDLKEQKQEFTARSVKYLLHEEVIKTPEDFEKIIVPFLRVLGKDYAMTEDCKHIVEEIIPLVPVESIRTFYVAFIDYLPEIRSTSTLYKLVSFFNDHNSDYETEKPEVALCTLGRFIISSTGDIAPIIKLLNNITKKVGYEEKLSAQQYIDFYFDNQVPLPEENSESQSQSAQEEEPAKVEKEEEKKEEAPAPKAEEEEEKKEEADVDIEAPEASEKAEDHKEPEQEAENAPAEEPKEEKSQEAEKPKKKEPNAFQRFFQRKTIPKVRYEKPFHDFRTCLFALIENHKNAGYELLASGLKYLTEQQAKLLGDNLKDYMLSSEVPDADSTSNPNNDTAQENEKEIDKIKEELFTTFFLNRDDIDQNQCLQQLHYVADKATPFFAITVKSKPPVRFYHAVFKLLNHLLDAHQYDEQQMKVILEIVEYALPTTDVHTQPNLEVIQENIVKLVSYGKDQKQIVEGDFNTLPKGIINKFAPNFFSTIYAVVPQIAENDNYAERCITSLFHHSETTAADYSYKDQILVLFSKQKNKNIVSKIAQKFQTIFDPKDKAALRHVQLLHEVSTLARQNNIVFTSTNKDDKFLESLVGLTFSEEEEKRRLSIQILMNIYNFTIAGFSDLKSVLTKTERKNLFIDVWKNVFINTIQDVRNAVFIYCAERIEEEVRAYLATSLLTVDNSLCKLKEFKALFKVEKNTQSYYIILALLKEFSKVSNENFEEVLGRIIEVGKTAINGDLFNYLTDQENFLLCFIHYLSVNVSTPKSVQNIMNKNVFLLICKHFKHKFLNLQILTLVFILCGVIFETQAKLSSSVKDTLELLLTAKFPTRRWNLATHQEFVTALQDVAVEVEKLTTEQILEILRISELILNNNFTNPVFSILYADVAVLFSKYENEEQTDIRSKCIDVCLHNLVKTSNIESKRFILATLNDTFTTEAIQQMTESVRIRFLNQLFESINDASQYLLDKNVELACSIFAQIDLKELKDESIVDQMYTSIEKATQILGIRGDCIKALKDIYELDKYTVQKIGVFSIQNFLLWTCSNECECIRNVAWSILCYAGKVEDETKVSEVVDWVKESLGSVLDVSTQSINICTPENINERWLSVLKCFAEHLVDSRTDAYQFYTKLSSLVFDIIDNKDHKLRDQAITLLPTLD